MLISGIIIVKWAALSLMLASKVLVSTAHDCRRQNRHEQTWICRKIQKSKLNYTFKKFLLKLNIIYIHPQGGMGYSLLMQPPQKEK